MNTVILTGRVTKDIETRDTSTGRKVASFTIAVDRRTKDGKATDFFDCVAWGKTAELLGEYVKKGNMIVVNGRLQLRNWTDKDGNKRRSAEILASNVYFGESKKTQEGSNPTYNQNTYPGSYGSPAPQQNQPPQNYGGYPQYPQQSYQQPQYNQQGFGGYQQNGYQSQGYQPPHPAQGSFAPIEGDDAQLPF